MSFPLQLFNKYYWPLHLCLQKDTVFDSGGGLCDGRLTNYAITYTELSFERMTGIYLPAQTEE